MKHTMKMLFLGGLAVVLQFFFTPAQADEVQVTVNPVTQYAVIRGQLDSSYSGETMMFAVIDDADHSGTMKEQNIKYFNSFTVQANGSFIHKFKCSGIQDIERYKYFIRQAEMEIQSGSLSWSEPQEFDLSCNIDFAHSILSVNVANYYGDSRQCVVAIAVYGQNNQLIDVRYNTCRIGFNDFDYKTDIPYEIPENAARLKIFALDNLEQLHPLSKSIEINVEQEMNKRRERIENAANHLFGIMDPGNENTASAYEAYLQGNYSEALKRYRNYFVDKIRSIDFGEFYQGDIMLSGSYSDQSRLVTGEWTLQDYQHAYPGSAPTMPAAGLIGDPAEDLGAFNWVETWNQTGNYSSIPTSPVMHRYLAGRYYLTQDEIYLNKFMQLMSHYALYGKAQAETFLQSNTPAKADNGVYWTMDAQCALSTGDRLTNIMQTLACFSKFLTLDKTEVKKSDDFLKPVSGIVPAEKYNMIDEVQLAEISYSLVSQHLPYLYEAYLNRLQNAAPNQRNSGLKSMVYACHLYNEFIPAKNALTGVDQAYNEVVWDYMHKDGGFLEQSFNYNEEEYKVRAEIVNFLKSLNIRDGLCVELEKSLDLWERLADGYRDPLGKLPQIGNLDNRGADAVWKSNAIAQNYKDINHIDETDRGYNSVYFPISGYGAMRSGWSMLNDIYLGFTNARKSLGHASSNVNSLWLTAFGRQMLLSGHCPWYSTSYAPDRLLGEYEEMNDYFEENSTMKNSTVIVNGKSQSLTDKNGSRLTESPQTPINARWLTSGNFDFAEGLWDGGYYKDNNKEWNVKDLFVKHLRQIFYVKDGGFFVVLDNMKESAGHTNEYRQIWGFSEFLENSVYNGYTNEQVVVDQENHLIKTQDTNGPNLWLMQFSGQNPSYHKYYGDRNTDLGVYLGWGGPTYNKVISRIPKVDVHVGWSNQNGTENSQMITVAYPVRTTEQPYEYKTDLSDSTRGINGFEMKTKNNKLVSFYSSPTGSNFEVGDIKVVAKSILIVKDLVTGVCTGLVLDCDSFKIGDIEQDKDTRDFEFNIAGDALQITQHIEVPGKFEWVDTEDGSYPVYK